MANENIRMSDTTDFEIQDWLKAKHNACGPRPDSDAQRIVTAEWANHVDESLKECNRAFNGLPVAANNVCGSIHTMARATVQTTNPVYVPLIDGVPAKSWTHLELKFYFREVATEPGNLNIGRLDAVFSCDSNGTLTREDTFQPTWFFPNTAAATVFNLTMAQSPAQVQAKITMGELAGTAYWTLDYRFIVLPQTELVLPDALPGPAPCVLAG